MSMGAKNGHGPGQPLGIPLKWPCSAGLAQCVGVLAVLREFS